MKFFVVIAVTFLVANCDGLFFGEGSGNVALKGNFHHKQPVAAPAPEVIEPVHQDAPVAASKGFDLHGIFKNHKWLSGKSNSFQLQGSLQGLLKNHRLFAGHFNKNQASAAATVMEDPFGGDNTGFSVSTGESDFGTFDTGAENVDFGNSESNTGNSQNNAFSETAEIPEPRPISNDVQSSFGLSGSSGSSVSGSFSAKGGHDFHKILGGVVEAKIKLLEQAKNKVNSKFENHVRNLEKFNGHFKKSQTSAGSSAGSSFDGQFSVNAERRRY